MVLMVAMVETVFGGSGEYCLEMAHPKTVSLSSGSWTLTSVRENELWTEVTAKQDVYTTRIIKRGIGQCQVSDVG